MSQLISTINHLLAIKLENTNCFLVEIKVTDAVGTKIQVFADCLEGITIKKCVELSRHLETELEERGLVPEKYVLEVSSPGADKAFKVPQQYTKNIGELVEIKTKEGQKMEGILLKFDEEHITIEAHKAAKNPKNKQLIKQQMTIPFTKIKATKRKIVFK